MKILYYIFFFMCFIFVTGCDNQCAHTNNCQKIELLNTNSIHQYWKVCIDGKEFIEGNLRFTINLDENGKPIPCEVK